MSSSAPNQRLSSPHSSVDIPSRHRPSAIALAVLALGMTLTTANAFAQTAPAKTAEEIAADKAKTEAKKEAQQLETVTITATGRPQSASSVPYNATAISEEALREGNVTDIKKFIQLSPSINAPGNSARFADSVTVRGLNVSPVSANNIEYFTRSTLAYYLDDTPLPNIGYRIKDVSRVETLLGPQGTLYGAGSLGGTIRYITNAPEFDRVTAQANTSIYSVKGGALSNDTDMVFNIPFAKNVAFRASIANLNDAGYTDRVSNPSWRTGQYAWTTIPNSGQNLYKNDDYNYVTGGRFALAWKINSDLKITLAHTQQKQLAHGTSATSLLPLGIANAKNGSDITSFIQDPNFSPCAAAACTFTDTYKTPFLAGYDVVASRYPEFANRDFKMTSLELDWNLGFAKLRSSTATYKDTRVGQADYAGQGWAFYYDLGDAGAKFDSGRSAYMTFNNAYTGFNHETRLTSTSTGPLSWIAGIYHSSKKSSLKFSEYLPGLDDYNGVVRATSGGNLDEGYRENLASQYKETALYGEVSYLISPQWSVTGGARVFNYSDTGTAEIRDYSYDLVNNNVTNKTSQSGKSYFKLNTSYNFMPNALVYATVSEGFRRGGVNGFRNVGTKVIAPDVQSYKPDSTRNYEIGVKGTFLDRSLYVQADVYRIDWKDVQTYLSQTISGFPVNGTTNGPTARSQGFEISTRYKLNDNWQLSYASAYTDAKWTDSKTVCRFTDGTGCRAPYLKGGILGGSPTWKHNAAVRYSTSFSNGSDGFISLAGRYTGTVPIDRSDDPAAPVDSRGSYTIFDLRAGMSFDKFDVTLWAENITNKRAEVSSQPDIVLGRRLIFTTPRTIGVNVSYAFK